MDILFRREQTPGGVRRVNFKLWSKLELDEEESTLITRYRFDEAVLIDALQPDLLKLTAVIGFLMFTLVGGFFFWLANFAVAMLMGLVAGIGGAYAYYHDRRETIYVRDLVHGRDFKCKSVIELAKKEAWLANVAASLRQVMVGAKHWNGTEHIKIDPLPEDEAKQVLLSL